MKLLHTLKFISSERWDNDQFISNIKMLELELKIKSAKISINITDEFQATISKKSKGVSASMIIKPHGMWRSSNRKTTTSAITIRYPEKLLEKLYIYSKNANKFFQIIPEIVNILDKEIQRKLTENLKNNHDKRLYQVKVEKWVNTVKKFDGDIISSSSFKIGKIIISKYDKTEITPIKFNVEISDVNRKTVKKIIALVTVQKSFNKMAI